MHIAALLLGLALLAGCATHPITGRDQILALPSVQAAYSDVGFALSTGAQRITGPRSCWQGCSSDEAPAAFTGRIESIALQLEASARDLSPELFERIERFRIEVSPSLGIGTGSSAGGRIALGTGLIELEPSDTVLAFLIAREMAHVIARHEEENSGASMTFSALGFLLPGINVVAKFIASAVGSGALKSSWAAQQRQEADEIAIALLERGSISAHGVALELASGLIRARVPEDEWGVRYIESMQRVALIAATPPRYAVFGD